MGLVQDVHAAVSRYEETVGEAALTSHSLAATIETLADRLAADGPLGTSTDPDLALARTRLAIARQKLLAAAEAADASRQRARQYAERAFPT